MSHDLAKPEADPTEIIRAEMEDAGPGHPNWARFKCDRCGWEKETHTATDGNLRNGIPCPRCNRKRPRRKLQQLNLF